MASSLRVTRPARQYLPESFVLSDWNSLTPYVTDLSERDISAEEALKQWLEDLNEFEAVLQEDFGWRYIRMSTHTKDTEAAKAFQVFLETIAPKLEAVEHELHERYWTSPARAALDEGVFWNFNRGLAEDIALFREANLDLNAKIELRAQQYGTLVGDMTVMVEGETLTLQQAARYLESSDRAKRQEVWEKIATRRLRDKTTLNELFDELRTLRHQVATNANEPTFTDFMFRKLHRHDYGRAEAEAFHQTVEKVVKPAYEHWLTIRKERLGLTELRPWDLAVDPFGETPLAPFADADDFVAKAVVCLNNLQDGLGETLAAMKATGHLDLESRVGKAPGGYNYPLHETGVPFIFMNAVGVHNDLITLVHEAGHALHAFRTRELPYNFLKDVPSEVAELASMSMEFLSMEHWDIFYPNPNDLRRAKLQQLERAVSGLPWIACVDAFQTWLYDHPAHTAAQREAEWVRCYRRFHGETVSYEGFPDILANLWQRQLHLFEVPFYYIEYGFAQLGAYQVWQRYRQNPPQALADYLAALELGNRLSIGDTYARAGATFAPQPNDLRALFAWVQQETEALLAG